MAVLSASSVHFWRTHSWCLQNQRPHQIARSLESDQKCSISQEYAKYIYCVLFGLFGAVLLHIHNWSGCPQQVWDFWGMVRLYGVIFWHFVCTLAIISSSIHMSKLRHGKTRLMGSLALTGAGRLYLGFTKSVYVLFICIFLLPLDQLY